MNSYLLIAKTQKTQEEKASTLCQTLAIDPLDITIIRAKESLEKKATDDTSKKLKGIALIREIYKTIHLTPVKGKEKALVILEADGLSIPAQNSLLKTIEEPPKHTKVMLTTENKHLLLQTILSRCLIIEESDLGKKMKERTQELSEDFIPQSLSQALVLAEKHAKDKQTALLTLEEELGEARDILINEVSTQTNPEKIPFYLSLLKSYTKTYQIIKTTNTNLRFALEHLYLSNYLAKSSLND